ncbi:MAG TPA: ATP-binding protein [Anaerolineales bacterium]|nr:ATP-binding protein [Anaerolineales bacterium]
MKIVLKPDWDIPVQIPNKEKTETKGHFVGRETELSVFTNELLRREQGAILITGYRGVGKTSFVYKALHQVLEKTDKDKLLFVFINANHLETSSIRGIHPKPILVNLIRRLYAVTQDKKLNRQLKQDIETIYKKSVSSEFRSSEVVEKSRKSTKETEISRQSESSLQQIGVTQFVWFISLALAAIFQFFPAFPNLPWLNKILPLLLAFPIPVLFSWFWRYTKSATSSESVSGSAQQLYTMDNSVNNLEFDLEKLHRDYSDVKTVYVIDELDKLDADVVLEIMRYFKNLFTLSSAMFVFIGGEELFNRYQSTGNDSREFNRSVEYTYFTSKYFLSRPTDAEVLKFLDEIIENHDELKNNIEFEYYKRSLIFESSCDYFDLIQVMKGKINKFDGLNPVLDINIEQDSLLKAKLQKALSVVFNEKYVAYNPIRWSENELVVRNLYAHIQKLLYNGAGSEILDYSQSYDPSSKTYKRPIFELATNDLNGFLNRLGFLELVDYSSYNKTSETYISANKYYLTKTFTESIPDNIHFLSQLEEMLVTNIGRMYQIVTNYWNVYAVLQNIPTIILSEFRNNPLGYSHRINHWGIDAKNAISEIHPIFIQLTSQPVRSLKREDVEKYTELVEQVISRLMDNAPHLLARIFQDSFDSQDLQIMDLKGNSNLFAPSYDDEVNFRQKIVSLNLPHDILTRRDFSRQLMFCQKVPTDDKLSSSGIYNNSKVYMIVITDYKETDKNSRNGLRRFEDYSFSLTDSSVEIERKIKMLISQFSFS